jgi:hypothetical protein
MQNMQLLHNLYASPSIINDQVKEDDIGRACTRHEEEEVCIQDFLGESQKETIKKTKACGKIILSCN